MAKPFAVLSLSAAIATLAASAPQAREARPDLHAVTGTATETVLYSFGNNGNGGCCLDATYPNPGLIQAADGSFYGLSERGGPYATSDLGTAFRIVVDPTTGAATETVLYSFNSNATDGNIPYGGLIQGKDGNFYGMTGYGGAYGYGTVFKLVVDTATGTATETILHSFNSNGKDGTVPWGSLVQGTDGNFYGTTSGGGAHDAGTVFRLSIDSATGTAKETILHSFGSTSHDGQVPYSGLMQGTDGNFYGTTYYGGAYSEGAVFRISINPTTGAVTEKVLHSFDANGKDGANPQAPLIQGSDGAFYGTTFCGGANTGSSNCGAYGYGTAFRIAIDPSTGKVTETVLHSFANNGTDGTNPRAPVMQASDGNYYGTTIYGGTNGIGAVFELTVSGAKAVESVLYSFGTTGSTDGNDPDGLIQGTDGNFYGTTFNGGAYGSGGTFFRIVP